jgi:hypothetical protein
VLYLAWDALSGTPLFGERKPFRSVDDLKPLLERVREMQVPVIGIVTDKEKGLVPAVSAVFPDVPYQFCHTHFLKNCAKPLQSDLHQLGASVARRADRVRDIEKNLPAPATSPLAVEASPAMKDAAAANMAPTTCAPPSAPSGKPTARTPLTEEELAREICDLVRANSRVSGKAPLDPPELARHERLNEVRALVNDALKKKTRRARPPKTGPCSADSIEHWR